MLDSKLKKYLAKALDLLCKQYLVLLKLKAKPLIKIKKEKSTLQRAKYRLIKAQT